MKVMVIGGGGREHAIVKAIKKNPNVETIYALPGNGGIAADAVCVPIGAKDIEKIAAFAKEQAIDFAVVAPDDPLAMGAVDRLHALGIPCFGPEAKAAEIESSKVFAKNLMRKYGIPTAAYAVFEDAEIALAYLRGARYPSVIKADGLALGKGVIIVQNYSEAEEAIDSIMRARKFGESGSRVVVEEYLTGPEVSVLAFTDGKTLVPMVSSMDHKRALDGDRGPNTGGMGTVAPNPYYTKEIAAECMETIFLPTIRAMAAEGRPDAHAGRPEGDRIQLPFRRPGNAGRPAAFEERPLDGDAGCGGRPPCGDGGGVCRWRGVLRGRSLRRIPGQIRERQGNLLCGRACPSGSDGIPCGHKTR